MFVGWLLRGGSITTGGCYVLHSPQGHILPLIRGNAHSVCAFCVGDLSCRQLTQQRVVTLCRLLLFNFQMHSLPLYICALHCLWVSLKAGAALKHFCERRINSLLIRRPWVCLKSTRTMWTRNGMDRNNHESERDSYATLASSTI